MHCFSFTPIESASVAEWRAFYEATDQLPKKIPGISQRMVWQAAASAYCRRATPANMACAWKWQMRTHSRTYTDHAFHKQWMDVYSKVRVEGTTTFDILGQ